MNEKFNKNAKVEKFTSMLGIAIRLIVIDPLIIRSRSVTGSKIGVMPDQWRVSLYGRHPECRVTFGRGGPHIV